MTANQPTRAYNDHNVYILGAGFSAEAGLPLIKDFMDRMREAAAWLEEQGDRKGEVESIEAVLDFRLKAAAAAYRVPLDVENIEDLFSLASASGPADLADHVTFAIAATLDYCARTAPGVGKSILVSKLVGSSWNKPPKWKIEKSPEEGSSIATAPLEMSCPPYEFYLGLMCGYFNEGGPGRRDTIISFNYDTVVEDALWSLALPFRYAEDKGLEWRTPPPVTEPGREPIPLLKLHGSVNLTAWGPKDESLRVRAYRTYEDLRRETHKPMLVAPTWQKSVTGHLSAVWSEAVSALRMATRVVIMGYSMPTTDQDFRYLLAAGLQENISLRKVFFVNLDSSDDIRQRLCNLFRREHVGRGQLIEHVAQGVCGFLVGEASRSRRDGLGRALNSDAWRLRT